jgi:hypothetical protein
MIEERCGFPSEERAARLRKLSAGKHGSAYNVKAAIDVDRLAGDQAGAGAASAVAISAKAAVDFVFVTTPSLQRRGLRRAADRAAQAPYRGAHEARLSGSIGNPPEDRQKEHAALPATPPQSSRPPLHRPTTATAKRRADACVIPPGQISQEAPACTGWSLPLR